MSEENFYDLSNLQKAHQLVMGFCSGCSLPHILFLDENGKPIMFATFDVEAGYKFIEQFRAQLQIAAALPELVDKKLN